MNKEVKMEFVSYTCPLLIYNESASFRYALLCSGYITQAESISIACFWVVVWSAIADFTVL